MFAFILKAFSLLIFFGIVLSCYFHSELYRENWRTLIPSCYSPLFSINSLNQNSLTIHMYRMSPLAKVLYRALMWIFTKTSSMFISPLFFVLSKIFKYFLWLLFQSFNSTTCPSILIPAQCWIQGGTLLENGAFNRGSVSFQTPAWTEHTAMACLSLVIQSSLQEIKKNGDFNRGHKSFRTEIYCSGEVLDLDGKK